MKVAKSSNIIRPQRGILFYLACFSGIFVGIGSMLVLINKIAQKDFSNPLQLLLYGLAANALWYSLLLLSSKAELSIHNFSTSNLITRKTTAWSGISEVRLISNRFNRYQILIIFTKKNRFNQPNVRGFPVSIYGNMKELAQAVVEAAYKANPNLVLNEFTLEMLGGYPPYGIFKTR
jgi:hypothetical protein